MSEDFHFMRSLSTEELNEVFDLGRTNVLTNLHSTFLEHDVLPKLRILVIGDH